MDILDILDISLLMMAVVVRFAGIVHFNRCCSTSGLLAVTSFHLCRGEMYLTRENQNCSIWKITCD